MFNKIMPLIMVLLGVALGQVDKVFDAVSWTRNGKVVAQVDSVVIRELPSSPSFHISGEKYGDTRRVAVLYKRWSSPQHTWGFVDSESWISIRDSTGFSLTGGYAPVPCNAFGECQGILHLVMGAHKDIKDISLLDKTIHKHAFPLPEHAYWLYPDQDLWACLDGYTRYEMRCTVFVEPDTTPEKPSAKPLWAALAIAGAVAMIMVIVSNQK